MQVDYWFDRPQLVRSLKLFMVDWRLFDHLRFVRTLRLFMASRRLLEQLPFVEWILDTR